MSLYSALQKLGFEPCYHPMKDPSTRRWMLTTIPDEFHTAKSRWLRTTRSHLRRSSRHPCGYDLRPRLREVAYSPRMRFPVGPQEVPHSPRLLPFPLSQLSRYGSNDDLGRLLYHAHVEKYALPLDAMAALSISHRATST
jgi:hypothetical protein